MHDLNVADFQSSTWNRLTTYLEERVSVCSRRLESTNTTESDTQVLRGRILELRSLLDLEDEFHSRLDAPRLHGTPDTSLT